MRRPRFFTKLSLALVALTSMLTFSSCSSTAGAASAETTIDPRFIGTWVGQAVYRKQKRDVVLVLSPSGKGVIHARGNGSFDKTPVKWSTRSNILELRENVPFYKVAFNVSFGNAPHNGYQGGYRSYGQSRYGYTSPPSAPSPLGGVRRYNVISFQTNSFSAKDVANPRIVDHFRKYSKRPTSDPYPAFSWMDNGGLTRTSTAN